MVYRAKNRKPFQKSTGTKHLLIAGDSVMFGIGTEYGECMASFIANDFPCYKISNISKIGSYINFVTDQIKNLENNNMFYDVIILECGSNDLVINRSKKSIVEDYKKLLMAASRIGKKVVFMYGNISTSPAIPFFLTEYIGNKTLDIMDDLSSIFKSLDITVVNLFTLRDNDVLYQNKKKYYSMDWFHPNSRGYRIWYKPLRSALVKIMT